MTAEIRRSFCSCLSLLILESPAQMVTTWIVVFARRPKQFILAPLIFCPADIFDYLYCTLQAMPFSNQQKAKSK